MLRRGKESLPPPVADDETVQDTRWLNGVNRQLQPDAPSQRQAASHAAADKRKANAMPEAERKRRRADHAKQVRAAAKAAREQAAAAAVSSDFARALRMIADVAALGEVEELDFLEWLLRKELAPDEGSLEEWRGSDSYERTKRERIAEGCTCFLELDGGKVVTSLPYDELKRRVTDSMLQADESFEMWDERVLADRKARCVSIGEYFERPWLYSWCGRFRQCTCTYDGHSDEARVMPDVPGQNCDHYDEQLLEPQAGDWQPSGAEWVPEGWGGAEVDAMPPPPPQPPPLQQSPPPPPPPPPPETYEEFLDRHRCKVCDFFRCQCAELTSSADKASQLAPDESDAYELDQESGLEEQGRTSLIHGRPWHEVPSGATEPKHWLDHIDRPTDRLASTSKPQHQRPLSPAPEAANFDNADEFLRERARWFCEHADGNELLGETRREQNEAFQRLKDRLFGLRRNRANPSGTSRAMRVRSGSEAGSSTGPPPGAETDWGPCDDY